MNRFSGAQKRFYATIDISKLDKVKLLKGLWKNAQPALFYSQNGVNPPAEFCEKKAKEALATGHTIDYHQGRAIKMDLNGSTIENSYYVRYWGQKAFSRALRFARVNKSN